MGINISKIWKKDWGHYEQKIYVEETFDTLKLENISQITIYLQNFNMKNIKGKFGNIWEREKK